MREKGVIQDKKITFWQIIKFFLNLAHGREKENPRNGRKSQERT